MTEHLTQIFDNVAERGWRNTPPGMAHWTGTGPERTRCFQCRYCMTNGRFAGSNKSRANSLKPIHCRKYKALMRQKGPAFEAITPSCKHFEKNEKFEPLTKASWA